MFTDLVYLNRDRGSYTRGTCHA